MLRRTRAVVVIVSLLLLGAPALPAGAAPAAAAHPAVSTVPTSIAGLSITAPTHSLVRDQLALMTVRLHLVDPDGVVPRGAAAADKGWNCPCLVLTSFSSSGAYYRASPQASGTRIVSLRLVSGTPQDGVWRGTTIVGAIDAGIWRPTALAAGDFWDETEQAYPDSFVAMPADWKAATSFNLRGYDWPRLSITVPTTVTPIGTPFVIRGTATTSRTHQPLPGLRVLAGTQVCTIFDHFANGAARTISTGAWAMSSTDPTPTWCVWWAPDGNGFPVVMAYDGRVHVSATVTVRVTASSVPAGRTVTVYGVVKPAYNGEAWTLLLLERYYSGAWRRVSSVRANWNGAYRLATTVPAGSWRYRVHVMSGRDVYGTTSPQFTLRGY